MANTAQAKKRAKQSSARRAHNRSQRTLLRGKIKQLRNAIASKNSELAKSLQSTTQSIIDKMVTKHIIHKNAAARYKSRLSQQCKTLSLNPESQA